MSGAFCGIESQPDFLNQAVPLGPTLAASGEPVDVPEVSLAKIVICC
jgi:hypothetical protein